MWCQVDGCEHSTRSTTGKVCWEKYRMCFKHCVEFHPEEYKRKYSTDNLPAKLRKRPWARGKKSVYL